MFIDKPCSDGQSYSLDITYDTALLHIKAVRRVAGQWVFSCICVCVAVCRIFLGSGCAQHYCLYL
jgi:hypothetical protein